MTYSVQEGWGQAGAGATGVRTTGAGTSATKGNTFGKRVQVVYGTAPVIAVPLTVEEVPGGADYKPDGGGTGHLSCWKVQLGLAYGVIHGVEGIIYGTTSTTGEWLYGPTAIATHQLDWMYLASAGAFVDPVFTLGDPATAAVWSEYSASTDDNWLVPYGHIACMRQPDLYGETDATQPLELKAIVRGLYADTQSTEREHFLDHHWDIYDANPADVITDLLENDEYGLGLPAGTVEVDVGANGAAASSYRNACTAYGLWIALAVDEDAKVVDIIGQILTATNAVGFWEGATFKVVPLFDTAKTANGATFTPVLEALEIDDDHLVRDGENPVTVRRRSWSDTTNCVPVEWSRDTALRDAELVTTEDMNTANATDFGVRRSDPISLPCIRNEAHAKLASRWLAERSLYNRAEFEFTVTPRAAATIQVGDLVSLVHVPMGLDGQLVRVTETDENARGDLVVRAVEWHTGATITINSLPRLEDGA
jgi:hypothetical protein